MKHTFVLLLCLFALRPCAQELFQMRPDTTRWASFENQKAGRSAGAMENKGAKGHAFESIEAGETKTLLDVKGSGIVTRIWLTINDRSPEMLRSLRLDMYWDGESRPAVSVPAGDFFGIAHGQMMAFENALFSDPEGRSFNCRIPMPFRKAARITLSNDANRRLDLFFYDVDFQLTPALPPDALYFHCHWRRETKTVLGKDFDLLPEVSGKGRFLGVNIGVITAPEYGKSWWGEGEVKLFMDGDKEHPTIVGTGTEDYVGSAWGLGKFINWYQGCPVADDSLGHWAFYRFHIPDPVYFHKNLRAVIQVMGGFMRDDLRQLAARSLPYIPVTVNTTAGCIKLLEGAYPPIQDAGFPDGWVNFYRQEDYCATAYFYLDKPSTGLPPLPSLEVRTWGLK